MDVAIIVLSGIAFVIFAYLASKSYGRALDREAEQEYQAMIKKSDKGWWLIDEYKK